MQLMMQVVSTKRTKGLRDVRGVIEKCETKAVTLSRDVREDLSPAMKTAILTNLLPHDVQELVIQQHDRIVDHTRVKDQVLSAVEARLAMRNPDDMDRRS